MERPQFDVTHLRTRLRGNNVPFPDALIKTILRLAIPGLIQRKLLGVVPKELGSYLLQGGWVGGWVCCSALKKPGQGRDRAGWGGMGAVQQ